jgi:parallel beta-helix repeat protein
MTVAFTKATVVDGVDGITAVWGNNLSNTLETVTGSINRAATFVVAASNSSDAEKNAADYLCDGTEDQTEINQAIDAAAALSPAGGTVYLCGGTYNVTGSILLKSYINLRGAGLVTKLFVPNGTNSDLDVIKSANELATTYYVIISDLFINGNKSNQSSGTMNGIQLTNFSQCILQRIKIQYLKGAGVIFGTSTTISWADIIDVYGCDGAGISLNACGVDNIVSKCYCASNNTGIDATSVNDFQILNNNIISNSQDGIDLTTCTYGIIQGNMVRSNSLNGICTWSASSYLEIIGNHVSLNGQSGLTIDDTSNSNIINNIVVGNGTATNNTYDNIVIFGASNANIIQGNMARKTAAGNQAYYGLRISSGANTPDDNVCTNNDLLNSGVSGNFLDQGTNTVTTAGNRVS